jgi:ribosomal protein S18 acetylase RimI-like enzyme
MIREATREDARAIAEIHVAAWRAAYRDLMPEDYLASLSVEKRTATWRTNIGKPGPAKVALAELDGAPAGFCSFGPTRDEPASDAAEIYAVYVQPECWRQGAGRLLCEHSLREAAAREHRAMTLWVLKGNHGARRFYERLGFAADGGEKTDTSLIGSPLHDVRYRKAIA